MRYGENIEGIEYIEVTEKRFYYVKTNFKYVSLSMNGRIHYHLARNRLSLENRTHDDEVMDRLVNKIKEINKK